MTYVELDVPGSTIWVRVDPDADQGPGSVVWPSFGEFPVYDDSRYDSMTTDVARNERFTAALGTLVNGRVALDIGTGQHLNWARESARLGASHVTAIEVMPDTFEIARSNLREWGLHEKITLLQGSSNALDVDHPVDVCTAEIVGSIAGAEGAASVLLDAKRRHLAPGGVVIPHRAVTQAAAVCFRASLDQHKTAFSPSALPYLREIFKWNGAPFDVRLRIANPARKALISTNEPVEILEFNGDLRTEQEHRVTLWIRERGHIDGVLTWLRLWCTADEHPLDVLDVKTNWASVYFPLFDREIAVDQGDRLELCVRTVVGEDGVHPDYELTAALFTSVGVFEATQFSAHHGRTFRAHPLHRALFSEERPI